jgi:hypothetical protein
LISDKQLAALCHREIEQARRYDSSELAGDRSRVIEYFNGEMNDFKAEKGRSSAVSTDIADVIGWAMPGLQRIFGGSDKIVELEPVQPNDEAFAEQATEYLNFIFDKDANGYKVLYDAMHDSCLLRVGWIKHWWHTETEEKIESYTGQTDDAYTSIVKDDDVEVLEHDEQTIEIAGAEGQLIPVTTHDCKLKRTVEVGKIKLECIAPEDIFYNSDATSIDDVRFIAHRSYPSRSDLIEQGYKRSIVDALPTYAGVSDDELDTARDNDGADRFDQAADKAMQTVEIYECYIKADKDDSGVAMWQKVVTGSGSKQLDALEVEEWGDELPFTPLVGDPIPHRFEGRSLADEVIDQQRIKTVLLRQTLDNLYLTNSPEREVVASEVINPQELTSKTPGNVIRVRSAGAIREIATPFVAANSFQMLDYCDGVIEKRTGVSRATMALDPDALQNQTATAVNAAQNASHSKIELLARNFAENGLKRLFKCLLKLVVQNQDAPRIIRLRDQFVPMDPRGWNVDMDVSINTGLGTGSRDRDMAMLNVILQQQIAMMDRAEAIGARQIVVEMVPLIRNSLAKLVNAAGFKNPDMYFPEVDPQMLAQLAQPQEQGGGEEAAKMQAEMQMEQAKMQGDMQLQREKAQADIALKREEMQARLQLKREEMALEAELAAMKAQQMGQELNAGDMNIRGAS